MSDEQLLRRWRLVLGRYARQSLDTSGLSAHEQQLEQSLDYLYGRAYDGKGMAPLGKRGANLDPSQIKAIDWLQRVRKLFPHDVYERIQQHAIENYQMSELLQDPLVLRSLEPNHALARTLLGMRGRLGAEMRDAVQDVIRAVVEEITRRLRQDFVNALVGRRNRFRRSHMPSAQNFDWRATIQANLRHYDRNSQRLVIEQPRFNARIQRKLPWDVVLCVDQSGSMLDSVMYSAVVAGILSSLPAVQVRLVVFDTNVVDLSHMAADPVQVLLTVQLGGGTDIGRAMEYCESLVRTPQRTVVALISDFDEGALPGPLLRSVRRLAESRVKLLGLAALDEDAHPAYDRKMAQRLAGAGMEVAALTPTHFAEWLAEVMG
ncbi:VWA domain-containing protein [Massilia sp. erpn]|uniref:VWA domain-containing protein n=1 Tax=Massilia sp. erpn TaxID=2738142 RepID=UPI002106F090|nr:VWA domain-containing protein [Massilia sp. erpn]UTY58951.1 VWA domain-containing protein [Massilia sp. erpn]